MDSKVPIEGDKYKNSLRDAMRVGNIAWWEMHVTDGTVHFHDRKARVLGYNPDDFDHYEDFTSLIHPEDYERAMNAMRTHVEGKRERYDVEYRIEASDGSYHWFHDIGGVTQRNDEGSPKIVSGLVIDITERKETKRQLTDQRDNLEVLNQVLRHDIRNDLQLVSAYADLLAERLSDENQEYVETIQENATHAIELTTTARDMTDVWLSDSDEQMEIPLKSTLESVLDAIRSTHSEAVITVNGRVPESSVLADDMLNSVFHNVLANALQHNDKDVSKVEVTVTEREQTVLLRIADNGPGVPDDRKETIFGKGEKGLDTSGTGLGLYLVKTLVESYEGDVWVEDNEPEGAVFVIELQKPKSGE